MLKKDDADVTNIVEDHVADKNPSKSSLESDDVSSSSNSSDTSSESESDKDPNDRANVELADLLTLYRQPTPSHTTPTLSDPSDLKSRLASFLPQIKQANEAIEESRRDGTLQNHVLDNAQEGEECIEMNLGLGVLEHRDTTKGQDESDSASDSDEEVRKVDNNAKVMRQKVAPSVMDKLTGQSKKEHKEKKVGIEEI